MLRKIIGNSVANIRQTTMTVLLMLVASIANGQVLILEGTFWRGSSSSGRDYQIEFMPNGILKYSTWNGQAVATYENTKWQLSSNQISLDFNNGFANWQGVVTGDNMSGTAKNKNGTTWSWEFKKINIATAPPFDQIIRKSIPNPTTSQPQGNPSSQALTNNALPTSQVAQNTLPRANQKSFKFIPTLRPQEINRSVIQKGMSPTDLDIFLTMYGFIWSMNDWLGETPDRNSTRWMGSAIAEHQKLVQHKSNAQLTLNKFEETISILAANIGLTNTQFKEAIGIIEVFTPPSCDRCQPGYKTLKHRKAGLISEVLDQNRDDITSDGITVGLQAFGEYRSAPGTEFKKNDKGHPGLELNPAAFLDFYSKWIPAYYLNPSRLSSLQNAAASTEERIEKQQFAAEQARAKRQEDERKRQEFLNSPEGKRQIAKEQEETRIREKQLAKDYPFYAVITCGQHFPVYGCFAGNVNTELELRNGNEYKMYTVQDIMGIPQNQNGIMFNLRNKFELKMQNSSDNLILNLKIYNRANNSISFEKSASRFGVIRVSN